MSANHANARNFPGELILKFRNPPNADILTDLHEHEVVHLGAVVDLTSLISTEPCTEISEFLPGVKGSHQILKS